MNDQTEQPVEKTVVESTPVKETATPKATVAKAAVAVKKPAPKKATAPKAATKATPVTKKAPVAKAEKAQATAPKAAKGKAKKIKMVRDSFTFPATEHVKLLELKKRVMAMGHEVKKGELVRLGITLVAAMTDTQLLAGITQVEKLKTGRPKQ